MDQEGSETQVTTVGGVVDRGATHVILPESGKNLDFFKNEPSLKDPQISFLNPSSLTNHYVLFYFFFFFS